MLLALLFALQTSRALTSANCQTKARAIFDLGSGTVKLTLAAVNQCPSRSPMIQVIDSDSSVPLALEANKDESGNIPPSMQKQAISALSNLKRIAIEKSHQARLKKIEWSVVATHALRTAKNQEAFRIELEKSGFPVKIISQTEEANIGYQAVFDQTRLSSRQKCNVVWDMGGGSTQLTFKGKAHTPEVIGLNIGAEKFKFFAIKTLSKNGPSPNPIGIKNLDRLLKKTKSYINELLPPKIPKFNCAIGIGGVHNKAIYSQIRQNWSSLQSCVCPQKKCSPQIDAYSKNEVHCLTKFMSRQTDDSPSIKGPYSTTTPTNSIFIDQMMAALGLDIVHVMSVNMGTFLIKDQSLLHFQNQEVN